MKFKEARVFVQDHAAMCHCARSPLGLGPMYIDELFQPRTLMSKFILLPEHYYLKNQNTSR